MNISMSEVLVVLLIALLIIKPEQFPDIAFSLGRLFQSFRKMIDKIKKGMQDWTEALEKHNEQNTK